MALRQRKAAATGPPADESEAPVVKATSKKTFYTKKQWCLASLAFILWAPVCWIVLDYCYLWYAGKPWAPIRSFASERNPDWHQARYRAPEHAENPLFNQWYYNMISDAETNLTFSFGFGGFRADSVSGGWMKIKGLPGIHEYSEFEWPEVWYPFENMVSGGSLNITVYRNLRFVPVDHPDNILFQLTVLDDRRLRYFASFPEQNAEFDIVFTRIYGTYSGDEKCKITNLPFAYGSLAQGHLTLGGRKYQFDHSMRFRAYVESTWGCTFPRPGLDNSDPIEYPWKWMWLMLPDPTQYQNLASPFGGFDNANPAVKSYGSRTGAVKGEVGIVVANARMYDETLGTVTGTFAFIDLPEQRLSGVNVTLWDASPSRFPIILASSFGGVRQTDMMHGQFMPFHDSHGDAFLPRQQNLTIITDAHEIYVQFVSDASDYVRVAVPYKDSGGRRHVCSDFRASHSATRVLILRRLSQEAYNMLSASEEEIQEIARERFMDPKEFAAIKEEAKPYLRPCPTQEHPDSVRMCMTLVDAEVPHNAVEFAYHAPYAVKPGAEASLIKSSKVSST